MTQPQPIQSESASAISMLDALIRDAHGAVKQYRVRDAVVALINAVECLAAKREPESSHLSDLLDKVAGLEKENHALRFELGEVMGERDTAIRARGETERERDAMQPTFDAARRWRMVDLDPRTPLGSDRRPLLDELAAAVDAFNSTRPAPSTPLCPPRAPPPVVPVEVAVGEGKEKCAGDCEYDYCAAGFAASPPDVLADAHQDRIHETPGTLIEARAIRVPQAATSEGERQARLDRKREPTGGEMAMRYLGERFGPWQDDESAATRIERAKAEDAHIDSLDDAHTKALERADKLQARRTHQRRLVRRAVKERDAALARAESAESALANVEASLRIEWKAREAAEKELDDARLELAAVGGDTPQAAWGRCRDAISLALANAGHRFLGIGPFPFEPPKVAKGDG
jgi:hypothetical protein